MLSADIMGHYWHEHCLPELHVQIQERLPFLLNASGGWTAYANDAAVLHEDYTQHKTVIRLAQHPFFGFAHSACDWIFYTKQAGETSSLITAELCIVCTDADAQQNAIEWIVAHYQKAGGFVVTHPQASMAIACAQNTEPEVLIKKIQVNQLPCLLLTTAGAFYSA
jgi:hypothetical protein